MKIISVKSQDLAVSNLGSFFITPNSPKNFLALRSVIKV
jgi:hypothetical protein